MPVSGGLSQLPRAQRLGIDSSVPRFISSDLTTKIHRRPTVVRFRSLVVTQLPSSGLLCHLPAPSTLVLLFSSVIVIYGHTFVYNTWLRQSRVIIYVDFSFSSGPQGGLRTMQLCITCQHAINYSPKSALSAVHIFDSYYFGDLHD